MQIVSVYFAQVWTGLGSYYGWNSPYEKLTQGGLWIVQSNGITTNSAKRHSAIFVVSYQCCERRKYKWRNKSPKTQTSKSGQIKPQRVTRTAEVNEKMWFDNLSEVFWAFEIQYLSTLAYNWIIRGQFPPFILHLRGTRLLHCCLQRSE